MEESEATASAIISFSGKLEDESSRFYGSLAEKFGEDRDTFLSFVKEGEKNKILVVRTYQETITDALEACFSFKGLHLSDYLVDTDLTGIASYGDALKLAIELEDKASRFYSDVAELSKSLLATIPKAFERVAERRNDRKSILKTLAAKVTAQR